MTVIRGLPEPALTAVRNAYTTGRIAGLGEAAAIARRRKGDCAEEIVKEIEAKAAELALMKPEGPPP